MTAAQAVRWHGPGDVRLECVQPGEPGPGEVLIRCVYCGACGSDLHEIHDGPHAIPTHTPHYLSKAVAPITLGHEFSGYVAKAGDGVTGLVPGAPVVIEPNYRCGDCPSCRAGRYHLCRYFGFAGLMGDGGMAQYAVVPAYMVHPLPESFDLAQAAVLEPAAVALHAIRRSGLQAGDSAAVIGLGPVGLLVCALLRLRGVETVIGIDPVPTRRDQAQAMGATALGAGAGEDTVDRVRELTGGIGVDAAFEVVGTQATFTTGLHTARPGGRLVLVGLADQLQFNAFDLVNQEISIIPSVGYNNCHLELIDLVHAGDLDLSAFTNDLVALEQAPQVLMEMAVGGIRGVKTLIDCTGALE
ncbi:alcohol dehydrogenase catalytic domain-containing protein [Arthrobacter sp. MAHUQ-56]